MTELTDLLSKPLDPPTCRFNDWVKSLPQEEQEAVEKAMDNPDWTSSKLTVTLKKFGLTSDEKTVRKHRKRECIVCDSE